MLAMSLAVDVASGWALAVDPSSPHPASPMVMAASSAMPTVVLVVACVMVVFLSVLGVEGLVLRGWC
jgi:hypothetical protein